VLTGGTTVICPLAESQGSVTTVESPLLSVAAPPQTKTEFWKVSVEVTPGMMSKAAVERHQISTRC